MVYSLFAQNKASVLDNNIGFYNGTINGALFIQRGYLKRKDLTFTILDFQGSKATLSDEEETQHFMINVLRTT